MSPTGFKLIEEPSAIARATHRGPGRVPWALKTLEAMY